MPEVGFVEIDSDEVETFLDWNLHCGDESCMIVNASGYILYFKDEEDYVLKIIENYKTWKGKTAEALRNGTLI